MNLPQSSQGRRRWLLGALLVVLAVLGLTVLARYKLIEPMAFAAACERDEAPWLPCLLRQVLVVLFVQNILGMGSTLLGVWCSITRTPGLAVAAICLGCMSMTLYRFDAAFIGVLLALLVLARASVPGTQLADGEPQHQPGQ